MWKNLSWKEEFHSVTRESTLNRMHLIEKVENMPKRAISKWPGILIIV